MKIYENKYFYYIRKPNNIPTTFGKEYSFLDYLLDNKELFKNTGFYENLKTPLEEFFLVNRLDNLVGGYLFFAKNKKIYELFRQKEKELKVEKYYIGDVYGDIGDIEINFPIMHHKDGKRMIAIVSEKDKIKGKGKIHYVTTKVKKLYYVDGISCILITINKGIRHQIRLHLSSIGYPLIGDPLYGKGGDILHLWSIGLKIND